MREEEDDWFEESGVLMSTSEVGQLGANELGLYDISAHVPAHVPAHVSGYVPAYFNTPDKKKNQDHPQS